MNTNTNICCFDLDSESLEYFESLGFNVFDGSFGSVFSIDWGTLSSHKIPIFVDWNIPSNLHEYHVFIHDMGKEHNRVYQFEEHQAIEIEHPETRYVECYNPVTRLDIRPFGSHILGERLNKLGAFNRISIIFVSTKVEMTYNTNQVGYDFPSTTGQYDNHEAWNLLPGGQRYGKRVFLEGNRVSKQLFENILDQVSYYRFFSTPKVYTGDTRITDARFVPLLHNEINECISYIYFHDDKVVDFVFPQIENKTLFLRTLFQNVVFSSFSEFFPEIEANNWIHFNTYDLPGQKEIRDSIKEKERVYQKEVADLEEKTKQIEVDFGFLKDLLIGSGDKLVSAVKKYFEWLGFLGVVDKDNTLGQNETKEEDLFFSYKGTLVLVEVKGINGTSTDSECSQVDKVVGRRMRQLKTTEVHGVYFVNNERHIEPLKRTVPPFNSTQIEDAKNQSRTLIYSSQLFALYFDIENGYIKKEEARNCILKEGLAEFHSGFVPIGLPYHYYQEGKIICLDLNESFISVNDLLYYYDDLHRLVGLKIIEMQQDKVIVQEASMGKTSFNVGTPVPRNKTIYKKI